VQSALALDVGLLRNCVRQRTATSSLGGLTHGAKLQTFGVIGELALLYVLSGETKPTLGRRVRSLKVRRIQVGFQRGFSLTVSTISIGVFPRGQIGSGLAGSGALEKAF
jgi:hypothetical protein